MTRRAWTLMLTLAALWGASYMFIDIALEGGVATPFVVFVRNLLGTLVLLPVALSRGVFPSVRRHLPLLTFVAAIQVTGPFLLITVGEQHITSSMAGILVASTPIFTAIIALVQSHDDRLGRMGVAGIVIGIVGVVVLFGVDLSASTETLLAGLGVLLAGLGYAVGPILTRRHIADVPPIGIAGSIVTLSMLMLLPVAPFSAPSEMPSLGTWAALAVLGAGGTGIAFLIFFMLNADVGPSRSSLVAYIAPFFSVIYGVTLLDESFSLSTAAGLLLILTGSWMAADGRVPWRRTAKLAEQPA
ncbi:MAG TPA: DMT family transporter [Solirubrobacteraceae bacterium]|jgi:drug/metabolite transporter (DMT)-like permease|nr:DMT family transporter [Solirubrobacteraceae bacterium]